jgi:DNA-binding winged helix-turn-helix (wHTH) protein
MSAAAGTEVFEFAGYRLDPRRRLLFGPDARSLPLTARAFDTLLYLVEHPNQLIDRERLMKAVWPGLVVEDNNLNQTIAAVRRALEETAGENRFVITVPGRGFQFVPAVTRREANLSLDTAGPLSAVTELAPKRRTRLHHWVPVTLAVSALSIASYLLAGGALGRQ